MKYLLSNKFKKPGWILFITGIVAGIFLSINDYESNLIKTNVISLIHYDSFFKENYGFLRIIENNILDEIIVIFVIIGGLLVCFSKEKIEDEFISKTRLDSLVWAILINYSILLIATIFIYEITYMHILIYNMFTPLLIFILRFNYVVYKKPGYEE